MKMKKPSHCAGKEAFVATKMPKGLPVVVDVAGDNFVWAGRSGCRKWASSSHGHRLPLMAPWGRKMVN